MGDDAVILKGVESCKAAQSFYSTVRGAGRVFGRKDAKRRLSRSEMNVWLERRRVTLIGGDLDEAPMAYRRLPDVLEAHTGTMRVLHSRGWPGPPNDPWKD
jgi:tRNA-splicing ligase RtcB (3'-phosphate/5'-hydroxy nucleic acid ligase)